MKYRVIEKTRRNGSTYYYAQYKFCLFWHYIRTTLPFAPYEQIKKPFSTVKDAADALAQFKEEYEISSFKEKTTKTIDLDL